MEYPTFVDLQAHIQSLYRAGDYKTALELASEQMTYFPENFHLLYYWRICLAARIGQNDLSIRLLDELLDRGFWYGETLLRNSPSLQPLHGMPDFEKRVRRNSELQKQEQNELFPLLVLRSKERCAGGNPPCPLLIALHADGSTAKDSVDFWRAAASAGWLVAIPQSTQAMWKNSYTWDDRELTESEVTHHYQSVVERYEIDQRHVVIAGHSMGGEIAIWLAIKGVIPAQGFIALGPGGSYMDDVENWTELLKKNVDRNLRGYLIIGQDDRSTNHENVLLLGEILKETGILTEIEEIPDVGHDYSVKYDDCLLRGLNFITE